MAKTASRRKVTLRDRLASPLFLLGVGALFILAGVAMALVFNGEDPVRAASSEARADAAPAFALPTVSGGDLALADYRGQVVLVNFWATWCPPCRAELPDLVSYYHDNAGRGFMLIGVNEQETAAQVADYLAQNRLDFPVALDADGRVMEQYGVTGMPSSFLINREGQIVRMWTGMITRATLESAITPLLGS
jgi:cytochrome c biogenesis protein CcmG/thiol:disulfide interchange protein DsbE